MVFDPVAKREPSSHKKFTLHLIRTAAPFAAATNFPNSLETNGISAAPLTPTAGGTHKCKAVGTGCLPLSRTTGSVKFFAVMNFKVV